jgi:small-conductance mechanosensitive channel
LLLAWSIHGALKSYVMSHAPESWKLAIGGINRVLFPLTSLSVVLIGKSLLSGLQSTAILKLAASLLLAMAVIRLLVYVLRYIFVSGGWLRATESTVVASIWTIWALHISGIWPQLMALLEDASFQIGKNKVNLLILTQGLITILLTLFIALWLSRMLENKLMAAEQLSVNMRVVLSKLVRILLSFIAVLMALSAVGLDITLLSVFGGALGVGLGFGLQKIASNYVSGFIILMDKSMRIGDVITVDKHHGTIEDMRSRYMVLRRPDGTHVIIPNETLMTTAALNHSLRADLAGRLELRVYISFTSALEAAIALIHHVAESNTKVLETPAVKVLTNSFGEYGVELLLHLWVQDAVNQGAAVQSELYLEIWKAFKTGNIKFAKPESQAGRGF